MLLFVWGQGKDTHTHTQKLLSCQEKFQVHMGKIKLLITRNKCNIRDQLAVLSSLLCMTRRNAAERFWLSLFECTSRITSDPYAVHVCSCSYYIQGQLLFGFYSRNNMKLTNLAYSSTVGHHTLRRPSLITATLKSINPL